jgi:hypothetical protein
MTKCFSHFYFKELKLSRLGYLYHSYHEKLLPTFYSKADNSRPLYLTVKNKTKEQINNERHLKRQKYRSPYPILILVVLQ